MEENTAKGNPPIKHKRIPRMSLMSILLMYAIAFIVGSEVSNARGFETGAVIFGLPLVYNIYVSAKAIAPASMLHDFKYLTYLYFAITALLFAFYNMGSMLSVSIFLLALIFISMVVMISAMALRDFLFTYEPGVRSFFRSFFGFFKSAIR